MSFRRAGLTAWAMWVAGVSMIALTTMLIGLNPSIRREVLAWVDFRFSGRPYAVGLMDAAVSSRLRDPVDLTMVISDLSTVVTRTLEPASTGSWLREERGR